MDLRPTPPRGEPGLPAVRPPSPVVRPDDAPPAEPGPEPTESPETPEKAGHRWRGLTRTRRGAAGVVVLAAALLLWPFAGWFWIPWLAGLVVLVLVALLHLDRVLQGWSWHLGGLVVLAGLMLNTGPWDWALAASLGVLLAGLVQLPWRRLAAVGAVLCLLAGAGWGVDRHRAAQERAAQEARASEQNRGQIGVVRPNLVLQVVLSSVGRGDVGPVCDKLLAEPAQAAFAAAAGSADCAAAVRALAARVDDPAAYARGRAPGSQDGDVLTVDACRVQWTAGATPGPQLGVLTVSRVGTDTTYVVTAFRGCST